MISIRYEKVNSERCISVCNAGYYKTGSNCELCTRNTIKSMTGDATDCNTDAACDGTTKVPNSGHTLCGKDANLCNILEYIK